MFTPLGFDFELSGIPGLANVKTNMNRRMVGNSSLLIPDWVTNNPSTNIKGGVGGPWGTDENSIDARQGKGPVTDMRWDRVVSTRLLNSWFHCLAWGRGGEGSAGRAEEGP